MTTTMLEPAKGNPDKATGKAARVVALDGGLDVGERLRFAMERRGMSPEQLAERSQYDIKLIKGWMSGKAMNPGRPAELARVLRVDPEWLRGRVAVDEFAPFLLVGATAEPKALREDGAAVCGEHLKAVREFRGMTVEALAERIGKLPKVVESFEAGNWIDAVSMSRLVEALAAPQQVLRGLRAIDTLGPMPERAAQRVARAAGQVSPPAHDLRALEERRLKVDEVSIRLGSRVGAIFNEAECRLGLALDSLMRKRGSLVAVRDSLTRDVAMAEADKITAQARVDVAKGKVGEAEARLEKIQSDSGVGLDAIAESEASALDADRAAVEAEEDGSINPVERAAKVAALREGANQLRIRIAPVQLALLDVREAEMEVSVAGVELEVMGFALDVRRERLARYEAGPEAAQLREVEQEIVLAKRLVDLRAMPTDVDLVGGTGRSVEALEAEYVKLKEKCAALSNDVRKLKNGRRDRHGNLLDAGLLGELDLELRTSIRRKGVVVAALEHARKAAAAVTT